MYVRLHEFIKCVVISVLATLYVLYVPVATSKSVELLWVCGLIVDTVDRITIFFVDVSAGEIRIVLKWKCNIFCQNTLI